MSDFNQEDHKGSLVPILLGASNFVATGAKVVPFHRWDSRLRRRGLRIIPQVGPGSLVGFGAKGQDPVRATGSPRAPMPKDETGAASPGPAG